MIPEARLWASRQRPTFTGETPIGYVALFVAVEPISERPLWSIGWSRSNLPDAIELARAELLAQTSPLAHLGIADLSQL